MAKNKLLTIDIPKVFIHGIRQVLEVLLEKGSYIHVPTECRYLLQTKTYSKVPGRTKHKVHFRSQALQPLQTSGCLRTAAGA